MAAAPGAPGAPAAPGAAAAPAAPASRSWSPPWWRIAAYLVASAVLVAGAPSDAFPAPLAVAVLVVALAARDAVLRPALSAGVFGLRWRAGLGSHAAGWDQLIAVRSAATSHRGFVHLATLELELTARAVEDEPAADLVVLTRHRLGTDPVAVAAELEAMRSRLS